MRQGNLVLALPHISAYHLECDRRRISLDKQIQRLYGSIPSLFLYRNDLTVFLYDEFKLGVVVRLVVVQGVAVFYQRFSNEVLINSTLGKAFKVAVNKPCLVAKPNRASKSPVSLLYSLNSL